MIKTTIERTDSSGQKIAVPADVLAVIEVANAYLLARLKPVEHLSVDVQWRQFTNDGPRGWAAELHVGYEGITIHRQFFVRELQDAKQMRDQVRELVWDFADLMSDWVGNNWRRMSEETARFAAESKE